MIISIRPSTGEQIADTNFFSGPAVYIICIWCIVNILIVYDCCHPATDIFDDSDGGGQLRFPRTHPGAKRPDVGFQPFL